MKNRLLVFAGVLALASLTSGCSSFWATFHDAKFNPPDGASGYDVFVVPLSETRSNFWYGESEIGVAVVDAMKFWARESGADAYFVEGPRANEVLRRVYDWSNERITSPQWRRLAEPLGARYVVEGDVLEFRIVDPKVVGMYSAEGTLRYRVVDVESGRIVHENKKLEASVGKGTETHFQATLIFDDAGKVRQALIAALGRALGEELYGYFEE